MNGAAQLAMPVLGLTTAPARAGDGLASDPGFAANHDLDYPVLSDPAGSVAELYGVKPSLLGKLGPLQRPTFAIGTALPFGLNSRQMNAWLYHGGGNDMLRPRTDVGRLVELGSDDRLKLFVKSREVYLRRQGVARIHEADPALAEYIK